MNLTELKGKWGKYTDTDKLVNDISDLLTTCNHANTTEGICKMLDTYFTQKEPLIKLLSKSKNYIGDMRILTPMEIERTISRREVGEFINDFNRNRNISNILLCKKDAYGKTLMDYLKVGRTHLDVSKLPEINKDTTQFEEFGIGGYTKASLKNRDDFLRILNIFSCLYKSNLDDDNIYQFKRIGYDGRLNRGLKTSRAFNRICCDFGVDKIADYNKLFAKYSDIVSPGIQNMDFIISVNPYDYLTMSFGHSWKSCHSIKDGGFKGGTLSYMLDKSSIITYVVNKDADPQTAGKVYRNMIHYDDYYFIQGRIYPQENDGSTNLYNVFRAKICDEMTELLELKENKWEHLDGTEECGDVAISRGVHYRDYQYNHNCNVFFPIEKRRNGAVIAIGAEGICPYCGEEFTHSNYISHTNHTTTRRF